MSTEVDHDRFRRLWEHGATEAEMVALFALTRGGVRCLRRELGLAPRDSRFSRPEADRKVAVEPSALPDMPPHPFWTPARDARVRGTGGRLPQIAVLAAEFGKPVATVQQRWHRLRAAA